MRREAMHAAGPLEGVGLGFRYGHGPWLFRNIDLTVRPGEVLGLFGPSGSGKSTLGRILAGYLKPCEGDVRLGGQALPTKGYHPVQMIAQHPERALNPRWRLRRSLDEAGTIDFSLLERLAIHPSWLERYPHECSGGELQRVCVARALGPPVRYVIADEMTSMLDAVTQAQLFHAVLAIVRERRLGLLVISHDLHLIRRVSDRLIDWEALIRRSEETV